MGCAECCLPRAGKLFHQPAPRISARIFQVEEKAFSLQHAPAMPFAFLHTAEPWGALPSSPPSSRGTDMRVGCAEAKAEQLSVSRKNSFISM